jgi:hypothetical protein
MKYFMSVIIGLAFVCNADAAVKIKNKTAERYAEQMGVSVEDFNEEEAIATLENDIRILDEEIAKCEKQKKGWIAATVIGSAGVVATGVAAGVQGVQIKEKKDELTELNTKKKELNAQKRELDNK